MDTGIYAVPGEAAFTICAAYQRPENTVQMAGPNPDPKIYVASHDGTWVVGDYKDARKASILKAWPIHEQLEALTEYMAGRPEKMDTLKQYIQDIKQAYPKP